MTQLDRSDFLLNIIFNIEGNTRMIKKLLQFSGNKFAIFLMVVLVILGGIYSSAKLKLELYQMLRIR